MYSLNIYIGLNITLCGVSMVRELSASDFDSFVRSYRLVLVDCYTDWCMPCKQMMPIISEVERETNIPVGKLNIERAEHIANQYNIMSVPTFLFFKNGQLVTRMTGSMEKSKLISAIKLFKQ